MSNNRDQRLVVEAAIEWREARSAAIKALAAGTDAGDVVTRLADAESELSAAVRTLIEGNNDC